MKSILSFKPVRTGFPIREKKDEIERIEFRFKPVRTGFPIREYEGGKKSNFVSSLFEQDSLFGLIRLPSKALSFQACSNRIPYSGLKYV